MTIVIVALQVLLCAGLVAYFRMRNASRQREDQRREALQEERIRMAEKRMADNGGHALSSRYAVPPQERDGGRL